MTKHTPGPWVYDETYGLILAENEIEIAACHAGRGAADTKANARLIAAAPELLDELKHAVRRMKEAGWICKLAEEAIAKAEGK